MHWWRSATAIDQLRSNRTLIWIKISRRSIASCNSSSISLLLFSSSFTVIDQLFEGGYNLWPNICGGKNDAKQFPNRLAISSAFKSLEKGALVQSISLNITNIGGGWISVDVVGKLNIKRWDPSKITTTAHHRSLGARKTRMQHA